MSDISKIEWTNATWNPVTGCSKVSQGCKNCYAERDWQRLCKNPATVYYQRDFTDVQWHMDRLDWPLRKARSLRIFVNSMSDLFHEDVPDEFILQVFDVFRESENGWTSKVGGERGRLTVPHIFQILTKRPRRMLDFCDRLRFAQNDGRGLYLADKLPHNGFNPMPALKNVWLGVSVEDQATADERIPLLLQTPAAVRWISAEPLLGSIDLTSIKRTRAEGYMRPLDGRFNKLDWVVAGGESGPNARPSHPDWFRSLRDQCAAAGVPYFFKQWGNWLPGLQSGNPDHVPLIINSSDQPLLTTKRAAGRLLDGVLHDEYPA